MFTNHATGNGAEESWLPKYFLTKDETSTWPQPRAMANEPKNARNGFQIQAGSGLTSNLNHSCQLFSFKYFSNLKDSGCVFWFLNGVNLLSSVSTQLKCWITQLRQLASKLKIHNNSRKVEKVKSLQMQNTINEECAEKKRKSKVCF